MVISFSVPEVADYLLKNGEVYTFRRYNEKTFDGKRKKIGRDWANFGRGKPKIADVEIIPIKFIYPLNLYNIIREYVKKSGFFSSDVNYEVSVARWITEIKKNLAGGFWTGWLYHVKVLERYV